MRITAGALGNTLGRSTGTPSACGDRFPPHGPRSRRPPPSRRATEGSQGWGLGLTSFPFSRPGKARVRGNQRLAVGAPRSARWQRRSRSGTVPPGLFQGRVPLPPGQRETRGPVVGDLGSSAEVGAGPRRRRESVRRPSGRRRSRRRSRQSAAARLGEGVGLSQDGGQGGEAAAAAGVSARSPRRARYRGSDPRRAASRPSGPGHPGHHAAPAPGE